MLLVLAGTAALAQGIDGPAVDFRNTVKLSASEMQSKSREYFARMQQVSRRIGDLESSARKKKDVVKLNCVIDKGKQVKGHIALTSDSLKLLGEAVAKNDEGGRQHEFTRTSIMFQKVAILGTEAEQCLGEDVSYVGATQVDLEVDPAIPTTDPTAQPLPTLTVDRPPEASPFV
jgi:hypothetical protein